MPSRPTKLLLLSALAALLLALPSVSCGGRAVAYDDASGEPNDRAGGGARAVTDNVAGRPGSAGRPGGLDFTEMMLAECELGFRPGPGEARCNYTYEGRCYEDQSAVCACACPGALCVFVGFQTGGGSPIPVMCQPRP